MLEYRSDRHIGPLGNCGGVEVFELQIESSAEDGMDVAEMGLIVLARRERRDRYVSQI